MINKQFTYRTLGECLQKACEEFKVKEESLNYEIKEEKKGFFNKRVTISVRIEENSTEKVETLDMNYNENDGTIKVQDGKIIVKNPKAKGNPAIIVPSKNIQILVDGKKVSESAEVYEQNTIETFAEENISQRIFNIDLDPDKLRAYITIKYVPQCKYIISDCDENNVVELKEKICREEFPPCYTKEEIEQNLSKNSVIYGIIEENFSKCLNREGVENLLIAEGKEAIPDEDDILDIKFGVEDRYKGADDGLQKIDFKNLNSINEVKKGEIIAVKITGKDGQDGTTVAGKVTKSNKGKKVILKVGSGCEVQGDNIISIIQGKPTYKNKTFTVQPVHQVNGDVDIKTGNIDFIGEVLVQGNVKEGMKVKAAGNVTINEGVIDGEVYSKSNINIGKNVIGSKIIAGGRDVHLLDEVDVLSKLKENIEELTKATRQIRELTNDVSKDGEIIKALLENKFKAIPKLYFKLVGIADDKENNQVINLIRGKLIGLGPIKIHSIFELNSIAQSIDKKIEELNLDIVLPVDVSIGYSQDSTIESSGNIYVIGKGEYVSNIISNDSVYFNNPKSIARGGMIKAKHNIKCNVVGSEGGVVTKLIVEKKGHIWAKSAYQNTIFEVGGREYILDTWSKSIHAYLDSKGELNVDKLKE